MKQAASYFAVLMVAILLGMSQASAQPAKVITFGKCIQDGRSKIIAWNLTIRLKAICDLDQEEIRMFLLSPELLYSASDGLTTGEELDTISPALGDCENMNDSIGHMTENSHRGLYGNYSSSVIGCLQLTPDCDCYVGGRLRRITVR